MYSISLLPKPAIRMYRKCTKCKQRYRILVICTHCPRISWELANTKADQMTSRCMQRLVTFKILYNWIKAILVICAHWPRIFWYGWTRVSVQHQTSLAAATMGRICSVKFCGSYNNTVFQLNYAKKPLMKRNMATNLTLLRAWLSAQNILMINI